LCTLFKARTNLTAILTRLTYLIFTIVSVLTDLYTVTSVLIKEVISFTLFASLIFITGNTILVTLFALVKEVYVVTSYAFITYIKGVANGTCFITGFACSLHLVIIVSCVTIREALS
jgi:hypothetical protein